MPLYDYVCDRCGRKAIEFQKMSSDPLTECPICKTPTYRKVPSIPNTPLQEFHKPIEMLSIAMEDDEAIKEFVGKCPDVEVSMDPNSPMYGVPLARCRQQKLDALDAAGFVETN
jgi:putative FmdB family regulatory protein